MKVRTGFVSNSSSSSFICEVSGQVESGWDLSFYDAGYYECRAGHIFSEEYLIGTEEDGIVIYIELEKVRDTKWRDLDGDEFRYSVPTECCPICQFTAMSDTDLINFLQKKHGKTRNDIMAEVKETYSTYQEFKNYIKG